MRRWAVVLVMLCAAAPGVPEPPGYWTGPTQAPVPATLTGGTVIHTAALSTLLQHERVVLIDVANAAHRPANLPATSLWMPPPHQDIPGSAWIPGMGQGALTPAEDAGFRATVQALTAGDLTRPVAVYCHQACWLSWNAAKRAVAWGYWRVYWYPDGVEGWVADGRALGPAARGRAGASLK